MRRAVVAAVLCLAAVAAVAHADDATPTTFGSVAISVMQPFLAAALGLSPAYTPPPPNARQRLHVIGAGLGRTGTASLKKALDHLGWTTYHMAENLRQPALLSGWTAVADAASTLPVSAAFPGPPDAIDAALDVIEAAGYNATVDFPACVALERMLARNPSARVVLGVRSSPEAWAASYTSTISRALAAADRMPWTLLRAVNDQLAVGRWYEAVVGVQRLANNTADPASAAAAYQRWAQHVQSVVPAEQLLVHAPQDGWRPLCEFLEVADCPTVPYPRGNDRTAMERVVTLVEVVSYVWWGCVGAVTAWLVWVALPWCFACRSFRREAKPKFD